MVMVSGKGVEDSYLVPSCAELLIGVLVEAADVCSHHLYAEYLEEEVAADRQSQKIPGGYVVAGPVTDEMS